MSAAGEGAAAAGDGAGVAAAAEESVVAGCRGLVGQNFLPQQKMGWEVLVLALVWWEELGIVEDLRCHGW